jgi:hypothetical protein
MKNLLVLMSACTLVAIACKKSNNMPSSLSLIQHKWMVVSQNGEALRYVGTANDYYAFNVNNTLYRFVDNIRDTSSYSLSSNGQTLSFYQITNGVQSATPLNYTIKILNSNQFIISHAEGIIFSLDSLKR